MTASLNIAMGVKIRAAKAVAATNQRTVKAATILQTRMRSFLARRKVAVLLDLDRARSFSRLGASLP